MNHVFVWTLSDLFGLALLGVFAFILLICGIAMAGDWCKKKIKGWFK
jgi:hypothetical protein